MEITRECTIHFVERSGASLPRSARLLNELLELRVFSQRRERRIQSQHARRYLARRRLQQRLEHSQRAIGLPRLEKHPRYLVAIIRARGSIERRLSQRE